MQRQSRFALGLTLGLIGGWIQMALASAEEIAKDGAVGEDLEAADTKIFNLADINKDGQISRTELVVAADVVFVLMDKNSDGQLSKAEVENWDSGYLGVARKRGKAEAINRAHDEVFAIRDLNGDGKITHDEYSVSALYDFYKADISEDGFLSRDEFLNHYRMIQTIRSAIR